MKRFPALIAVLLAAGWYAVAGAGTINLDTSFYTPPKDMTPLPEVHGGQVKNVILMIGDGMGLAQLASAQFVAVGPEGRLNIERMPVTGIVTTYSANRLITDSGAAGTALATGHKTDNYMIGELPDGTPVPSILEVARDAGLGTGLVVTSTVTHATPAVFASHEDKRADEDRIAVDMAHEGVQVILGGGRQFWVPSSDSLSERKDDLDLVDSMKALGYTVVGDREEMEAVHEGKLLGLFRYGPLVTKPPEPTLAEMTGKALELLSKNEKGFFVMVEGSQIDWAGHENDQNNLVFQTLHFDMAVGKALQFARENGETLVLVTADHETGGLTLPEGDRDGSHLRAEFSTRGHTASPVVIYAYGPGAENFTGVMDNTVIPKKIEALLKIKGLNADAEGKQSVESFESVH